MLLWLIFAGMTAAVLAVVLRPAFRPNSTASAALSADLAVYTEQLADLERQVARGQLEPSEYEALRTEVARRILRVEPDNTLPAPKAAAAPMLPLAVAALVPLFCVGLYGILGAPNVPGRPFTASAAQLANATAAELIAKVEARLASHPEDGRGWDTIAPIYFRLQRFLDAADAYQRAARLLGETPQRLAGFAEATVLAHDGIVVEPARQAYEKLRIAEPARFEPRFWLALAMEQDGKRDAAAAEYRAMLADAPADIEWRGMVEQRLAAVTMAPATRGPTDAELKASAAMTNAERSAMIEGMVESLAARLKLDGKDIEGWQRLITSYVTLQKLDKARTALADARAALLDDKSATAVLDELARRLELKP